MQILSETEFVPINEKKRIGIIELKRKLFHLFVVLLPVLHILGFSRGIIVILFTLLVIMIFPLEYYRLKHPEWVLKSYIRKSEIGHIAAYFPFIIGGYIIYLLFDWRITTYSLFISAFGDASAAIIGTYYGKHRLPFTKRKSVEGTIAAFSVSLLVILLLDLIDRSVVIHPLAMLAPIIIIGTDFIEDPPNTFLSDNFLNPVLCGVFFWAIGIPSGTTI